METFINNLRNWLVDNISMFMQNLVVPIGSLILIGVSIFCFFTGFLKLQNDSGDFKGRFVAGIFCIAGAVILGSIWLWGRAAAGV